MSTEDHSEIVNEMISESVDQLIFECIPAKKYSHEWNGPLLKSYIYEIFWIDVAIGAWIKQDGVEE